MGAFDDQVAAAAAFYVDGPAGEGVNLRPWPSTTWSAIRALVRRQPEDALGGADLNAIVLYVPVSRYPAPRVGEDLIQLPADAQANEPAPVYAVQTAKKDGGFWRLRCELT